MSIFFSYICTNSTVVPYVPDNAASLQFFARDVSSAFSELASGHNVVGRLAFFPVQRSVPNHLLCDGREVAKASFPELFDYLVNSQGTSTDVNYFVLPNYLGSFTAATTAAIETATGGTVSTPDPTPSTTPEEYPLYGPVDSGGRFRRGEGTEVIP